MAVAWAALLAAMVLAIAVLLLLVGLIERSRRHLEAERLALARVTGAATRLARPAGPAPEPR